MFTWDVPLDSPHCRRCGVPLAEVASVGTARTDLCTRCRARVETLPARSAARADLGVVDCFRCLGAEFDG